MHGDMLVGILINCTCELNYLKKFELESPPCSDDFPMRTSIDRGFSIAAFDYQRVFLFLSGGLEGVNFEPGVSILQKMGSESELQIEFQSFDSGS